MGKDLLRKLTSKGEGPLPVGEGGAKRRVRERMRKCFGRLAFIRRFAPPSPGGRRTRSSSWLFGRFAMLFLLLPWTAFAQTPGPAPRTPKDAAPIDMTGYWVAIVSEDWRFRMVTPPKGDYPDIQPLNDAGKKIADAWDPAKDEAAGEQCKGYGAGNIMRIPERLHITWQNDNTLKLETDAGMQTRTFRFGKPEPPSGEPACQGFSVASWEGPASGRGPGGSLKVI